MIVGPSVFGWITYTSFVTNVAHLGAIVLLFVVGLEFRARELASLRPFLIALAGVIVPWVAGFLVARGFGFETTRALLIGVALSATSIAITADTLRELSRLQSSESRLIIGAAVIDDVLALLALSLTEQFGSGTIEMTTIALMAMKAILFIAAGAWLGQIVLARLTEKIEHSVLSDRSPEFVFVLGLLTAFTYALIAEHIGLSAIVGAFVAGIVFEGIKVSKSRSVHLGAEYVRAAFGAVFFVSLGVLADLRTLGIDTLGFCRSADPHSLFIEIHRLRDHRTPHRRQYPGQPGDRRGHGTARRSRHGHRTACPEPGHHRSAGVCGHGDNEPGHNAGGSCPASQLGVP